MKQKPKRLVWTCVELIKLHNVRAAFTEHWSYSAMKLFTVHAIEEQGATTHVKICLGGPLHIFAFRVQAHLRLQLGKLI